MSSSFPIEMTDIADGIAAIVQQYWDAFALVAWEGFLVDDRGLITLNLDKITDLNAETLQDRITYGTLDPNIPEASEDPWKSLLQWINTYDPHSEIVLVVYGRNASIDDDVRFYRFDSQNRMTPPEVFERYNDKT